MRGREGRPPQLGATPAGPVPVARWTWQATWKNGRRAGIGRILIVLTMGVRIDPELVSACCAAVRGSRPPMSPAAPFAVAIALLRASATPASGSPATLAATAQLESNEAGEARSNLSDERQGASANAKYDYDRLPGNP